MAFGFVIDEIQSYLASNLSIFWTTDEVSIPVAVLVDIAAHALGCRKKTAAKKYSS